MEQQTLIEILAELRSLNSKIANQRDQGEPSPPIMIADKNGMRAATAEQAEAIREKARQRKAAKLAAEADPDVQPDK